MAIAGLSKSVRQCLGSVVLLLMSLLPQERCLLDTLAAHRLVFLDRLALQIGEDLISQRLSLLELAGDLLEADVFDAHLLLDSGVVDTDGADLRLEFEVLSSQGLDAFFDLSQVYREPFEAPLPWSEELQAVDCLLSAKVDLLDLLLESKIVVFHR